MLDPSRSFRNHVASSVEALDIGVRGNDHRILMLTQRAPVGAPSTSDLFRYGEDDGCLEVGIEAPCCQIGGSDDQSSGRPVIEEICLGMKGQSRVLIEHADRTADGEKTQQTLNSGPLVIDANNEVATLDVSNGRIQEQRHAFVVSPRHSCLKRAAAMTFGSRSQLSQQRLVRSADEAHTSNPLVRRVGLQVPSRESAPRAPAQRAA